MTIEKLILMLIYKGYSLLNNYDAAVLNSFSEQINKNLAFTEKQANLAVKILKKYKLGLKSICQTEIESFLTNPTFSKPLRVIENVTRLSITKHPRYGITIKCVFPYNETIIRKIRERKTQEMVPLWDAEEKCWFLPLNEHYLQFVSETFVEGKIEKSEELDDLIKQLLTIQENFASYIPILSKNHNNEYFVKNSPKNLPKIKADNDLTAMFEARKMGINVWHENFEKLFHSHSIPDPVKAFLRQDPSLPIEVDSQNHQMSELRDIVLNMQPTLFIIPGGSEMKKLVEAHEFCKSIAVANEQISVMFRLSNETDKNFNDFIKNNNLNNPLTDQTKVVIISTKVPKPILKQNIHFQCIINLGQGNVHYNMKNFVTKHENVIFFLEKSNQGNLELGIL